MCACGLFCFAAAVLIPLWLGYSAKWDGCLTLVISYGLLSILVRVSLSLFYRPGLAEVQTFIPCGMASTWALNSLGRRLKDRSIERKMKKEGGDGQIDTAAH
jgi:hypothetical protein